MKRKYIDHRDWHRIIKAKRLVVNAYQERFGGYASAIFIEKVQEKLVCNMGERQFCLADDGYVWIQRLPFKKNWAVTTMLDENENIIQWYFDITKQNDVDKDNEPFYDDLYLDVIVFPSGEIVLVDEDELEEALNNKVITQSDFDLAYKEANQIMDGIAKDIAYLSKMSYDDLEFFRAQLNAGNNNQIQTLCIK